jgi:hypothetical protein
MPSTPNSLISAEQKKLRQKLLEQTPVQLTVRELHLERELWKRECKSDLTAWCIEALRSVGQRPARHHLFMLDELKRVVRGETQRLMIFMPPNHAKTTYSSVLLPPFFMAQKPDQHIIGASHGGDYARDMSGRCIHYIQENQETLGFGLLNEATDLWRTTNGCVYRAAGAGGSITGRRADLFIIDDPIKGRQDADSQTIRDVVWNWYQAEVITRLNPGGRIILIQTQMAAGNGESSSCPLLQRKTVRLGVSRAQWSHRVASRTGRCTRRGFVRGAGSRSVAARPR